MFSNSADVPGKSYRSQGDTMTKKSTRKVLGNLSSYQLAHALATSLRSENREVLTAIKALVKATQKLDQRLARTEAKIERTATSLRVHRGTHKPRINKRYVSHKISKPEKAHLCEIWAANRHDPAKLKAEGRILARGTSSTTTAKWPSGSRSLIPGPRRTPTP